MILGGGVMESFKEGLAGVPCLDFPWQWEMGGELSFGMMSGAGDCSQVPPFSII